MSEMGVQRNGASRYSWHGPLRRAGQKELSRTGMVECVDPPFKEIQGRQVWDGKSTSSCLKVETPEREVLWSALIVFGERNATIAFLPPFFVLFPAGSTIGTYLLRIYGSSLVAWILW